MADQGGSLLSSLLGGNVIAGITKVLSKFTGLGDGVSKTLLGYLLPSIMGVLAKQFAGKTISAQGLSSLFAEK